MAPKYQVKRRSSLKKRSSKKRRSVKRRKSSKKSSFRKYKRYYGGGIDDTEDVVDEESKQLSNKISLVISDLKQKLSEMGCTAEPISVAGGGMYPSEKMQFGGYHFQNLVNNVSNR